MSQFNSRQYWENRYKSGGNSGVGSYGIQSKLKSEFLTNFIKKHKIKTLVEYGCGDGNNLKLTEILNPHLEITGVDVSETALNMCKQLMPKQTFIHLNNFSPSPTDLAVSLEVIFHLIEDEVFDEYMNGLTSIGAEWLIILSPDVNDNNHPPHVKKRKFTSSPYLNKRYELIEEIDFNRSQNINIFSDWKIFKKNK